jgi:hypothetical protein
MRKAILALLSLPLAGCAGPSGAAYADFAKQIASDPKCGHTDRVQGNLGGLTGNNLAVYLERTCPAPAQAVSAPATPVDPAP